MATSSDLAAASEQVRFARWLRSLWWRSQHKLVHAGQIGQLRRLLGMSPQW